jgi:hypothetical protein
MIQLQGSTQRARVIRADYANNTLHLSEAIQFSDGRGVALAYSGSAPDMGAHEASSESVATQPAPPTDLRVE